MNRRWIVLVLALLLVGGTFATASAEQGSKFDRFEWSEITEDAGWEPRAGLEAAQLGRNLYVIGGRTPNFPAFFPGDSTIQGDVWRSDDFGASWDPIVDTGDAFPARAYHEVVTKQGRMFVIGGQNFNVLPGSPPQDVSEFFNDVWASADGVTWTQLTTDAGFEGRAGLSAIVFRNEIYVLGGSAKNDTAIIGPGGAPRDYFNDVWKSRNGVDWIEVTPAAPWDPRAGAALTVKGGYLYLLGGEDGFLCEPFFPGCDLPYFNDVWRTRNGADWELVTDSAGWSPRPGHVCETLSSRIICFGGFGQNTFDPFAPANPMDMWESEDSENWTQVASTPWNATNPAEIKYDFDSLVVKNAGRDPAIYTFGGDRETFDFTDPLQPLNVDNDVWRFGR